MADTSRPRAPKSGTPGNIPTLSTERTTEADLLPAGAQTLGELHTGPSAPRGLDAAAILDKLQELIEAIGIVQRQGRAMCRGVVALLPTDVLRHPALQEAAAVDKMQLHNSLSAAQELAGESLARLFDDLDAWCICEVEELVDTIKASAGGAA